jgi:chitinase
VQTYTVVSGDTCSAIESRTGVSDAQLHALNPVINSGCTSTFPFHPFMSIFYRVVSVDLQIGQILCLTSGGGGSGCTRTYAVVSGDICSAIEARTGVSDAQLHALNPGINSGCTSMLVLYPSMSTFVEHFR